MWREGSKQLVVYTSDVEKWETMLRNGESNRPKRQSLAEEKWWKVAKPFKTLKRRCETHNLKTVQSNVKGTWTARNAFCFCFTFELNFINHQREKKKVTCQFILNKLSWRKTKSFAALPHPFSLLFLASASALKSLTDMIFFSHWIIRRPDTKIYFIYYELYLLPLILLYKTSGFVSTCPFWSTAEIKIKKRRECC